MSENEIKTQSEIERETIGSLLTQPLSKQTVVDGTTNMKTNIPIDQAIKGLEYLKQQETARNPFSQLGFAKTVPPGIE